MESQISTNMEDFETTPDKTLLFLKEKWDFFQRARQSAVEKGWIKYKPLIWQLPHLGEGKKRSRIAQRRNR